MNKPSLPVATREASAYVVSANQQVGLTAFRATAYQAEVVLNALRCYGFLIKSVALVKTTFSSFADVIEEHYDTSNPQTRESVKVLREVSLMNP